MSELWTVNTGHNLGTYNESITQTIALPINTVDSVTLISGSLPGGLRIANNNSLIGTPYEVKSLKEFKFVLRARKGNTCLLYTSPSPRDRQKSRMPSSA